jgi:hypothetical protein
MIHVPRTLQAAVPQSACLVDTPHRSVHLSVEGSHMLRTHIGKRILFRMTLPLVE